MYNAMIKESNGTCKTSIFEKMIKNGDVQGIKVTEIVDSNNSTIVTVKGYALVHIETDNSNFDLYFYDTEEYGFVTSGSEILATSIKNYIDEIKKLRITEIKTKKGKTYKATPIIETNTEDTTNDLPF